MVLTLVLQKYASKIDGQGLLIGQFCLVVRGGVGVVWGWCGVGVGVVLGWCEVGVEVV